METTEQVLAYSIVPRISFHTPQLITLFVNTLGFCCHYLFDELLAVDTRLHWSRVVQVVFEVALLVIYIAALVCNWYVQLTSICIEIPLVLVEVGWIGWRSCIRCVYPAGQ